MERDKLIEYISDKLIHNAGKSTAHISIPVLEAILTSLTAPVDGKKMTFDQITSEAVKRTKSLNNDKTAAYQYGFIDGAAWMQNKHL